MCQNQKEFSEILQNISNNPLRSIDWLIQLNRKDTTIRDSEKKSKKVVLSSIIALSGSDVESEQIIDLEREVQYLLDHHDKIPQRPLIVACFLRLLPEKQLEWLSEIPWRPKLAAIFDSQFSDTIYKVKRIDSSLMAHEKFNRLIEIMREQESNFKQSLSSLTSLESFDAHRERFQFVFNNKISKAFIHPFLPDQIKPQLDEVFVRAESYIKQRDDLSVVDAHDRVTQEMDHLLSLLESNDTLYSSWIAEYFCKNLSNQINEDFTKNKAVQPAILSIEPRDKKYPFYNSADVNLLFSLKNIGPGYAYDVRVRVVVEDDISLNDSEIPIGRLAPTTNQLVSIPAKVLASKKHMVVILQIDWNDFNHSVHSEWCQFTLDAQKTDVNWEEMEQSDPYSLEPVINEQELMGRKNVLNRLIAAATSNNIGSSIIHGQKRVGKTSIARVVQANLKRKGFIVIYLEAGDYIEPSAKMTISNLGTKLCKKIKEIETKLSHLDIPSFGEALSPMTEFIDKMEKILPEHRLLFILDEFDQLPLDLYLRGSLGDAFFLTLRSISSRPNAGFILVGGERMAHIMDCQGIHLNKWNVIEVDYFTRDSDWPDYRELVTHPVASKIEYSEDALTTLHDISAGNPYFTKLICQQVFRAAVAKRDCYITKTEVGHAIQEAVRESKLNTFQHFWEDGIFETGVRATEKSIRRRKILIALSDLLSKQAPIPFKMVASHSLVKDISSLESDLKEYVTRRILINNFHDDSYDIKVKFFHEWLKRCGIEDIIATFSDLDAVLKERQEDEKLKVHPEEILKVTEKWGLYKGQPITEVKVQVWLDQFEDAREQRAMFSILQGLNFYSNFYIRKKLTEANDVVKRGLIRFIEAGKIKRSDILA